MGRAKRVSILWQFCLRLRHARSPNLVRLENEEKINSFACKYERRRPNTVNLAWHNLAEWKHGDSNKGNCGVIRLI